MRKISCVSLLVAGLIMVSFSACLLLNYMTTMDKIKDHIDRNDMTHFEHGVYNGEIAAGILMLIGIGVFSLGYRLSNRKLVQ